MAQILDALRNDPDNDALHEEFARLVFEQPETVMPEVRRAIAPLTAMTADAARTLTVVEAKVTAVASDIESAATAAVKAVEGAVEGAFGTAAPALAAEAVAPMALFGIGDEERKAWKNYVATQIAQPLRIEKPKSLDQLKAVMTQAANMGCPVRAVGSGHAWSDSALTDGIVIETHGLDEEQDVDTSILKNGVDATTLYSTEAGVILHEMIQRLKDKNLGLINMGGYDGQTLAGVISTSTHGSGITLGSFSSAVESLVVVTADGTVLQIEKANGITDPAKFAAKFGGTRTLKQDDDLFNAAAVGVGCLGVIYAATIRVMELYYLEEVRVIMPWSGVKQQLQSGILDKFRHVEVLFNPHKINGVNNCLLTTRKIVPKPPQGTKLDSGEDVFEDLLGKYEGEALAALFNLFPKTSPRLLELSLDILQHKEPRTHVYYEILNIGAANSFPAVCAEYGVDVGQGIPAVEAIFAAADKYQQSGIYHSSPSAIRWVAASPGFLSMQPVPTCMIEIPNLKGVYGYPDIYFRYEKMLVEQFGARPHWGQMNFLTGSRDMIKKLYPQLDKWMAIFQNFNTKGRFYSVFTDRVGFSSHAP